MKKKTALFSILLGLFIVILISYFAIDSWHQDTISQKQTREAEGRLVLLQVSENVGKDFDDWQSLREYVWCTLLQKGMTRKEINSAMDRIGERPTNTDLYWGINFKNRYLDYNLAPIILRFDGPGIDAKLVDWEASTEQNFGAPRASCEIEENGIE